jgi:YaiO family outer membrane protein
MNFKSLIPLIVLLLSVFFVKAQTSDELFAQARKAAFDESNYPKAIALTKTALQQSPNYTDIEVFLGRLYTWSKKPDSARIVLNQAISKQPKSEDAHLALGYLEFWNDNSEKALTVTNSGLQNNPTSEGLLLLKAKILNDLKRWQEADEVISKALAQNSSLTEARALASRIKDNSAKNKVGMTYDYIYFDKQFDTPWHLASIDYGRQTKYGSITGRLNYVSRFNTNGVQFEVDAYPRISNTFYAYVSGAIAEQYGVFPQYRAGFSLYANLPLSFEAEAGFRVLKFGSATWIYTASIGKYYKSFWFNLRTFITPGDSGTSQSVVSLATRYYYGGVDDYVVLTLGRGISPYNQQNNILIGTNAYRLKSSNATLGLRKSIKTFNIITATIGYDRQEYLKDTKGNQLTFGLGFIRRF